MRQYSGESRDEWEHIHSPEDTFERRPSVDEDEAYERMRQREIDGEEALHETPAI